MLVRFLIHGGFAFPYDSQYGYSEGDTDEYGFYREAGDGWKAQL